MAVGKKQKRMQKENDIKILKDFLAYFINQNSAEYGICYWYSRFLGRHAAGLFQRDYPTAYEFAEDMVGRELKSYGYWFDNKAERVEFLKAFILHLEKAK